MCFFKGYRRNYTKETEDKQPSTMHARVVKLKDDKEKTFFCKAVHVSRLQPVKTLLTKKKVHRVLTVRTWTELAARVFRQRRTAFSVFLICFTPTLPTCKQFSLSTCYIIKVVTTY